MNKHTKLIVGALIAVLVLLIAAIISFSRDISKNSSNVPDTTSNTVNPDGHKIIRDENGKYGMSNLNGSVVITPEWEQLKFVNVNFLAATNAANRIGILDLDGNIVAPFIFSEMSVWQERYFVARLAESKQYMVYDETFRPLDSTIWDQCMQEEQQLILMQEDDVFYYTYEEDKLSLEKVELTRNSFTAAYSPSNDPENLSALQWRYAANTIEQVIAMIKSQDFSALNTVTDGEHENAVLSGASLKNGKVLRVGDTALLSVQSSKNSISILIQMSISISGKDISNTVHTLNIVLEKNQQGVWTTTNVQIS